MKFALSTIFLFVTSISYGQLINSPNITEGGKKQGLWMEFSYLDSMDINGRSRIIRGQKDLPVTMISEGYYLNGEKSGSWKTYWIDRHVDSNRTIHRKGILNEFIEYDQNSMNGIYVSYYKSGGIRLLGHYKKIDSLSVDTIRFIDQVSELEKDTIIRSNFSSKMVGNWYEFNKSGSLIKTIKFSD
jgi:hypothetical protein